MATDLSPTGFVTTPNESTPMTVPRLEASFLQRILEPVASLRLTVVLFALSIFLVLAGTFAQVDLDIWEVMRTYFRCWFAWVPFQIFIPPSFVVTPDEPIMGFKHLYMGLIPVGSAEPQIGGGFWFPGGKLIGFLLAANLLAAHAIRFKAQARGAQLFLGLVAIAIGSLMTWAVIAAGSNSKGIQGAPLIPYSTCWIAIKSLLGFLGLWSLYGAIRQWQKPTPQSSQERTRHQFTKGMLIVISGCLLVMEGWLLWKGDEVRPDDASMRILWQLAQGGVAGIALLAGCWIVFGKRAGIVLLHAGVGLLMYYELHVEYSAIEMQMNMEEGETTNFVHDIRTFEMSFTDTTNPHEDRVIAIPRGMLHEGAKIDFPELPFVVEVLQLHQNARLEDPKQNLKNPATEGIGTKVVAVAARAGTGVDTDSKVDMSAAYVKLTSRTDNKPLGTYLVGMQISLSGVHDTVEANGRTFEMSLRPKRYYYDTARFRLIDVRKEDYIGTQTPRHFASQVHILDSNPDRPVDTEKNIWMNNPLRFGGETFYQTNYSRDSRTGVESTLLSVVANSGWMIPYVSCMLVMIGMAAHFLMLLVRFLDRSEAPSLSGEQSEAAKRLAEKMGIRPATSTTKASQSEAPAPVHSFSTWLLTIAVVGTAALYILSKASPPRTPTDDYDLASFGRIPVVHEGRVKPLDSVARIALLEISSKTTVTVQEKGETRYVPAIRWLLDVISESEASNEYKVLRIENLEVLSTLGLKKDDGLRFRFSRNQVRKREAAFREQVELARVVAKQDRKQLSVYQRKLLELSDRVAAFDSLQFAFGLHRRINFNSPEETVESFKAAMRFERMISEQGGAILAVSPQNKDGEDNDATWRTLSGAWMESVFTSIRTKQELDPNVTSWENILKGRAGEKPVDFNRAVDRYLARMKENPPQDARSKVVVSPWTVGFESFFNRFQPFHVADMLYVCAFVLVACGWLGWTQGFNRAAFWLTVLTLGLHTFALVGRILISGRPPVTNLYSSAIFVGWACVALGLILELVYRLGIGTMLSAVAGYSTLLIADGLSVGGDTFTVLRAVLDTQFWLATHVTTISLGYSTTYLAGFLGLVYILRGVLTPSLTPEIGRELNRMMYGTLCFSIFFSFVGTVLGGLWADDSWGRFWGWDPKENGALIIVLWNALVLHARWGGLVKERGLALLTLVGNVCVSWSWWGVNLLGAGLHAYGDADGTANMLRYLLLFAVSQFALIAVGLLPRRYWRSQTVASA